MELILTQADLDAMPADLRQQLFVHLGGVREAGGLDQGRSALLSREQAIGLLREVSFHRAGTRLRALLDRLAYGGRVKAPSRRRMVEALGGEGAHLRRYLATLNRMTAKVTGRPDARLWEYDRASDTYTADAATRKILRGVLVTMKEAGKQEEPLWE